MTVIEMLEKRLEKYNQELSLNMSQTERSEVEARVAEIRNIIFILTANKQISRVE